MGKKVHSFFSPISENELTIINDSKFIDAISYKKSGDDEKAIELLNQIIKSKILEELSFQRDYTS